MNEISCEKFCSTTLLLTFVVYVPSASTTERFLKFDLIFMLYFEKIAEILRAEKQTIIQLEQDLNRITGKSGFLNSLVEENNRLIDESLNKLGLSRNSSASDIYDGLISRIENDDSLLFQQSNNPRLDNPDDCRRLIDLTRKIAPQKGGFFLKKEIAAKLLENEPPRQTLKILGYDSVAKMLAKEDLMEIYSSLRFLEEPDWLNRCFFKQYQNLKAENFEEREIEIKILGPQWTRTAQKFVQKKYHNLSHLKELGVIFIIPISLRVSGEILRTLSLLTHYSYEINFYSNLIENAAADEKNFSRHLISLLQGNVLDAAPTAGSPDSRSFLIITRYLAKDDENDHRLFLPHLSPEAMFWDQAEESLAKIEGLNFWKNLDWTGDFFRLETGDETLVSFNLVDTIMSVVKEKEMIKYLYHHQEALWNKIFLSYFGREKIEEILKKNTVQGWFEIK